MNPIEVLIAIQARSNSTRFPKKIYELIGGMRVLDHVIYRAKSAAEHVMKHTAKMRVKCSVAVLYPEGDEELVRAFRTPGVTFIAGPEQDVLTRYATAQRVTDADFVVRLTSDCPFIFPFIIAKHINTAVFSTRPHVIETQGQIDYLSNIEPECRTVADGLDCEIMSRETVKWLDANATEASDREHVTTLIRSARPNHLRQAFVSMHLDTSQMKLSVDTPQDLEHMREFYHAREHKLDVARRLFGNAVYEL